MQEGVINEVAAQLAREAGLAVVMDRCWLKAHAVAAYDNPSSLLPVPRMTSRRALVEAAELLAKVLDTTVKFWHISISVWIR
jgi:hypothetical protein